MFLMPQAAKQQKIRKNRKAVRNRGIWIFWRHFSALSRQTCLQSSASSLKTASKACRPCQLGRSGGVTTSVMALKKSKQLHFSTAQKLLQICPQSLLQQVRLLCLSSQRQVHFQSHQKRTSRNIFSEQEKMYKTVLINLQSLYSQLLILSMSSPDKTSTIWHFGQDQDANFYVGGKKILPLP